MRKLIPVSALIAASVAFTTVPVHAAARCNTKKGVCTADRTVPTVSIFAPTSGVTVGGTLTVSGSASDNASISRVEIKIDSGAFTAASGTTTWTYVLDTTGYPEGTHSLTARASDPTGNVATTSVTLTFSNAQAESEPAPSPSPDPSPSGSPVTAPPLAPGSIGGFTFSDSNRNGVYETTEASLSDQHLYLFDGDGTYLAAANSDATGWYTFSERPDGAYRVEYASDSWWAIRRDWVPTTTGSPRPRVSVMLSGTARVDFGWRSITRSTNADAPISTYTGPNGVVVQSYDDVVDAPTLYAALMAGSLVGVEAGSTTIRFDLSTSGSASTMASQSDGRYTYYHATCYIPYLSWLDSGESTLFHEYGHAWSMYYAYLAQQDPTLFAYLKARGLDGDSRVGTSYVWDPKEMIAEDYRQLFAPAGANSGQINTQIPPAKDVAGLREFLSSTFMRPPA